MARAARGKRGTRGRPAALALGLLLAAASAGASVARADDAEPAMVRVQPVRDGDLLACVVRTRGLPGDRIASSLESGLPSAIEMALALLDERDRVVAENRVSFRIAYDLWEEIFKVDGPGTSRRFPDMDALASFLEVLPRQPVTRIDAMEPAHRHRLRVVMELHPVAPRETERLDAWVAGGDDGSESRSGRADDEREVSVSLGEVIRFFYRGGRSDAGGGLVLHSEWFRPGEVR